MTEERNTGERRLSARSLIASLLLRSEPPRIRGARLVQWCGLFGVSEGTARVALSRMVDRGELRSADGTYELAGRIGARRQTQDWSLAPRTRAWRGRWSLALVGELSRTAGDRTALREAMRRARFAELREGVWTRPDNLPRESAAEETWSVIDAQCARWSARPEEDPVHLASALFATPAWTRRAELLTKRLTTVTRDVRRADERALAGAFVAGAAGLACVRSDPLLPPALGKSAAAGAALRAAYEQYEAAFAPALRAWFRART
jgi:phenylacetic acid degradation operon negative regulatory protein